jgi:hypothetical protein
VRALPHLAALQPGRRPPGAVMARRGRGRRGKPAFDSSRQQRFMFARHPGVARKMVKRAKAAGKGLRPGRRFRKKR